MWEKAGFGVRVGLGDNFYCFFKEGVAQKIQLSYSASFWISICSISLSENSRSHQFDAFRPGGRDHDSQTLLFQTLDTPNDRTEYQKNIDFLKHSFGKSRNLGTQKFEKWKRWVPGNPRIRLINS